MDGVASNLHEGISSSVCLLVNTFLVTSTNVEECIITRNARRIDIRCETKECLLSLMSKYFSRVIIRGVTAGFRRFFPPVATR